MQSISTIHPLQVLTDLEATCKNLLVINDTNSSETDFWSGLGFRISDHTFCINSNDVEEILDSNFQNNLSTVPGAKAWLSGLTSLRGQALPVIDLQQYIFHKKSPLTKNSRLIVVNYSNMKIGLIIDETCGLKQFSEKNIIDSNELKELPSDVKKITSKILKLNDQTWLEFSITKLENDSDFLNAARF